MNRSNVLSIENLKTYYFTRRGVVRAVDGVTFNVGKSEFIGLVGESGSGKSTLGLSILKIIPPPGKLVGGKIMFNGKEITHLNDKEMRNVRGKHISMVFQDPMTSLDPLMRIGDQLIETLTVHQKLSHEEAKKKAVRLLQSVGISEDRIKAYPHQLSGGMRQRVMIAMAISLNPELIIADEPTTALDVIVQDQILKLFRNLQRKLGMSVILISHDIALELEVVDKVAVLYGGWLVEFSPAEKIASDPLHPYTKELLKAIPNVLLDDQKLVSIPGNPPDLINPPKGCRFHPRCPQAMEKCRKEEPCTIQVKDRLVKCHLFT